MTTEITEEERKAIASLKRLAKKWPDSLWLFSASGTLCVMKYDEDGRRAVTSVGGVDQNYCVDTVDGITNDGGDW